MSDGGFTSRWEVDLDLEPIRAEVRRYALKALLLALEHLVTTANNLVPHQEGTLERSGQTDLDTSSLRGSVFYDTPYAVRQHEDLTLRHDDGRQAKYLENTLTGELSVVRAIVLHQLQQAMR